MAECSVSLNATPPLLPPQFDYLMRDSMYCGVKISCDFNRLTQFSKVGRVLGRC